MTTFGHGFSAKCLSFSASIGCHPSWLLAVMAAESDFNPRAVSPAGAVGLTQFMPSTLRGMGWKGAALGFIEMSAEGQLEWTWRHYLWWKRQLKIDRWASRAQLYCVNFMPAKAPKAATDAGSILSEKEWAEGYRMNRGLDANKDGEITAGELELFLARRVKHNQKRFEAECAAVTALALDRQSIPIQAPVESWADVQERLRRWSIYTGRVDGICGPATREGVALFLRLAKDASWTDIQAEMKKRGSYAGLLDGLPGPLTIAGLAIEFLKP